MVLIFAHDHIFCKNSNYLYSAGGFSNEIIGRYNNIFEEVVILSRQKEIGKECEKLTLIDVERTNFIEIPNFKSVRDFHKFYKARRIIEREIEKADCIIARLPSSIGFTAVEIAKKYKKPYLIEVMGCPWDGLWNHSFTGKIVAPFEYLNMRKIVKRSEFVVYVTENFLQNRYPTNGKNVSCSNVNLIGFDDTVLKCRKEKILRQSVSSKMKIGTVAAVDVKFKGQEYIIKTLGMLKRNGVDKFEYHLVGRGDQSYLRKKAEKYNVIDEVKFLGCLPHEKIFDWLDSIDIYAQPSRQEGLPRALIEAMSRGLPALGANTGGIPELIEGEFIFSNSINNIKEIMAILEKYDKKTMEVQAITNFNNAKKYDKGLIAERRNKIFLDFKDSV